MERATAAGIGWPLPQGLGERKLESKLFGNQPVSVRAAAQSRPQPDWKAIHEQLQQHRHLTLQLVWQEYRQAHPGSLLQLVLRALLAMAATPRRGAAPRAQGRRQDVCRLCGGDDSRLRRHEGLGPGRLRCLLRYWAPVATPTRSPRDQQLEAWIQAHIHVLEFFGGVPTLVVPDNTKRQ